MPTNNQPRKGDKFQGDETQGRKEGSEINRGGNVGQGSRQGEQLGQGGRPPQGGQMNRGKREESEEEE